MILGLVVTHLLVSPMGRVNMKIGKKFQDCFSFALVDYLDLNLVALP